MFRVIQLLCVLLLIKDNKSKCNIDSQRKRGVSLVIIFDYNYKFFFLYIFFKLGYLMVYYIVSKLSSMLIFVGKLGVIKKMFGYV